MNPSTYHHVFFNPPFFNPTTARLPPDPIRAQARFELTGTIADFIHRAAWLLVPTGFIHLVFLPARREELLYTLHDKGFDTVQVQPVLRLGGREAFLDRVTARKRK
ncbi:MAG: hypothetical protein H7832_06960 [Magnetococcus sp. DMHC-6]